jgi:hypothetical protein
MTALYEIVRNRAEFERLAESGELDPQTVLDTLESLDGELNDKAISVAMFCRNLEANAAAVREAGKAMLARAERLEKRADSIKNYLLFQLEFAQVTKVECPQFVISVRRNPPAVVIDSMEAIPAQYWRQPEPPAPTIDKKLIAVDLKGGCVVPGARLMQSDRIEIKEG